MNQTSVYHFIHPLIIRRKYVQNKLCQVYFRCPVEVISPGHLIHKVKNGKIKTT